MTGHPCDAVVWLLADNGHGAGEYRTYQLTCRHPLGHTEDHHAHAASETNRDTDAVPVEIRWPNTPARPQVACDRCTKGVMNSDTLHLWGLCSCVCHTSSGAGS